MTNESETEQPSDAKDDKCAVEGCGHPREQHSWLGCGGCHMSDTDGDHDFLHFAHVYKAAQ